MTRHGWMHRLCLLGTALAGMVLGHTIAYVLAIEEPVHRAAHLEAAGHSYWGAAQWLAITVAVWSGWAVFLGHLRRGELRHRWSVPHTAVLLAALQGAGFLLLEVGERLVVGLPLEDLLSHHLVFVGLAVQGLLALVGTALLVWLARAAHLLGERLQVRPPRRSPLRLFPSRRPAPRPTRLLACAWGLRGLPRLAPSP